jgi:hypothetical protein
MLKQGETGNDILAILDAITESDDDQPTLNEIEF